MKTSIAVVIPCFNSRETIEKCLQSVIGQTIPVDEIIVVDDGSTDDTVTVVEKFIQQFNHTTIQIIRQVNAGAASARNRGVKSATAAYISFLDSDDQWDRVKHQIDRDFLLQDLGYKLFASKYETSPIQLSGEISFAKQLMRNYFLTPATTVARDFFLENGGFDETMSHAEDYDLWTRLCAKCPGYLIGRYASSPITGKRVFGEKGLSADLKKMHQGVNNVYRRLFQNKQIGPGLYLSLLLMEKLKYIRRIIISFR